MLESWSRTVVGEYFLTLLWEGKPEGLQEEETARPGLKEERERGENAVCLELDTMYLF